MTDLLTVKYNYQGNKHSFQMPKNSEIAYQSSSNEAYEIINADRDGKDGKKDGIINCGTFPAGIHELITKMRTAGGNPQVLDGNDTTAVSDLYDKNPEEYENFFNKGFKFFKMMDPTFHNEKPTDNSANLTITSDKPAGYANLLVDI